MNVFSCPAVELLLSSSLFSAYILWLDTKYIWVSSRNQRTMKFLVVYCQFIVSYEYVCCFESVAVWNRSFGVLLAKDRYIVYSCLWYVQQFWFCLLQVCYIQNMVFFFTKNEMWISAEKNFGELKRLLIIVAHVTKSGMKMSFIKQNHHDRLICLFLQNACSSFLCKGNHSGTHEYAFYL